VSLKRQPPWLSRRYRSEMVSQGGTLMDFLTSAIRKFLSVERRDRELLLQAAFLVGLTRIGLSTLQFRAVQRLLAGLAQVPRPSRKGRQPSVDRLVWSVVATAGYMPRATCLTQALAAHVLLRWYRYPSSVHIGVTRGQPGQLRGHAWLESRGRIILGGQDFAQYTRLVGVA